MRRPGRSRVECTARCSSRSPSAATSSPSRPPACRSSSPTCWSSAAASRACARRSRRRRRARSPAAHQGHDRPVQHLVRPGRHRRGAPAARQLSSRTSTTPKIGGAGLCDDEAVEIIVEEGPAARARAALAGASTSTRSAGKPHDLAFTREGGHSFARILHAYGDATGKELAQTLINTVRAARIDPHLRAAASSST